MNEQLITPQEVAKRLSVTIRTVYTWMSSGKLPSLKFGGRVRVDEAELSAFIAAHRRGAADGE